MTLLTTDEYRNLHSTAIEDEALQLLLDAAEADIVAFTGGDDAAIVEWHSGGRALIALARPASSITSVVEEGRYNTDPTTLQPNDYRLDPSGLLLYRSGNGTNSRWTWQPGRVVVTYASAGTEDQRKVVQADLVNLAINYNPGVGMSVVGSWTEQYATAMGANRKERDEILARLTMRGRMTVVGG